MSLDRYSRQIILPDFGKKAQIALLEAKVLVIGAGGLGCPVLQFLASSGIGTLGIIDFDKIEISNLHRQILFKEQDIGKYKSEIAKKRLYEINSEIKINSYPEKVNKSNVLSIIKNYDIVVDCSDNFSARYLINDACFLLKKPLIYGAIYQYEGQVSVFNKEKNGIITNYRDLFPNPPQTEEIPTCNEAGVLGTLSGIIGSIQANEVIKLIINDNYSLIHKLLIFDIKKYNSKIFKYKNNNNFGPKTEEEFIKNDYDEVFCKCFAQKNIDGIKSKMQLAQLLKNKNTIFVDIRNENEFPKITDFLHISIPFSTLSKELDKLDRYECIIFICQKGIRSIRAAELVKAQYPNKEIKHVEGGIEKLFI